jgi:predicted nucleic acid-binding protein
LIIVSDTTPIITLSKIERLDLLQKIFENIMIPRAAYDEEFILSYEIKE